MTKIQMDSDVLNGMSIEMRRLRDENELLKTENDLLKITVSAENDSLERNKMLEEECQSFRDCLKYYSDGGTDNWKWAKDLLKK